MSWFKEFTKGIFQIYAGNTLDAFQPLDFFHFYPMWYDLWIERIHLAIERLDLHKLSYQKIKHLMPTPSSKRAIIQKIAPSFRAFKNKDRVKVRIVTNFFARMLMEACPEDPFAHNSNKLHNKEQILTLLSTLNWKFANEAVARKLGRLLASTASLVHGLYNDLVTDYGWDTYGPYYVGNNQTLLIRDFPDLQPQELWPGKFLSSYKELVIYGLYEKVTWKIAGVGCHTIVQSGSPIMGLKKYAVVADGRTLSVEEINALIPEFSAKAEEIYRTIKKMGFEQLKEKVLRQECYQLKKLFDEAGLDWQPTEAMVERIKHKPLLTGLLPHGRLMTSIEEFKQTFGFIEFEKEVLQ